MRAERLADLLVTFPGAEVRAMGVKDIAVVVTEEGDGVVFNIIKRPSEVAAQNGQV